MASLINQFTTADHDQSLAFRIASYNSMFMVLLAISCAGLFAVYNLLYMFLSPILWAVLVGTVLFPFKRRISDCFKSWLDNLDRNDTPLLLGIAFLPWNYFIAFSDGIFRFVRSKHGLYFIAAYIAIRILSYQRTFLVLLSWVGQIYQLVDDCIAFLTNSRWLMPLIVFYTVAYGAWLFVQEPGSIHKKFARSLSLPIWVYGLALISSYFGPLRVFAFAFSAIVLALISAGVIAKNDDGDTSSDEEEQFNDAASQDEREESIKAEQQLSSETTDESKHKDESEIDAAVSSDTHIQIIFGLCVLTWTSRHEYILAFVIIPLVFAVLRELGSKVGIFDSICSTCESSWNSLGPRVANMVHIIVAGPLRKFIKLLFTSDRMFVCSLKAKVDMIVTIFVMALLVFGSSFMFLFTIYQLHNESVHLIKLGSNVISSNPEWLKTALNYTEDQLKEHDVDYYIEQGYQQGRAWLASNVRSLADPKNPNRADELEEQVKFLVDNIYRMWEDRSSAFGNHTNVTTTTMASSTHWSEHLTKATNLNALKGELTNMVSENIDTIISIAQSLWGVILMNVSVLSTVVFSILGFVLGFGFDLLNFFIAVIVFLTVVYYLLASSTDRWLPLTWVQFLSRATIANPGNSTKNPENKADITSAIELAISGVFVLSAKMAIFYGLHTYFVHSLFDLNIVFVPSIVAAVFAAIPIMPPYSVLVFGAVELFLIRGEMVAGIVFSLMSVAPIMFADAAFYREVRNSHPYVTGLAIIGGIYWLGLQGAIIGPIILCSMLALVNVYAQCTELEPNVTSRHE